MFKYISDVQVSIIPPLFCIKFNSPDILHDIVSGRLGKNEVMQVPVAATVTAAHAGVF